MAKSMYKKRLEICSGDNDYLPCERFDPVLSRCLECGCFIKIKARLKSMTCPLKKWENYGS